MNRPPTIVIVHSTERSAKCTVRPLRGRPDFQFYKYPRVAAIPEGYVRLGMGGPLIGPEDASSGLLVLDGTWRRTEQMERNVRHLPVRSLPTYRTAYPRTSKVFEDPDEGLATVEAIYAAYHRMGLTTAGLFDHYHWGSEFLALNPSLTDAPPAPGFGGV